MARQEESSLKGFGNGLVFYYRFGDEWHKEGTGPFPLLDPAIDHKANPGAVRRFIWKLFEVGLTDTISIIDSAHDYSDPVNHPSHYTSHPSGVECIQITEHMGFCIGNAIKYLWRADLKNDAIEDLEKAAWYIQRELERRKND